MLKKIALLATIVGAMAITGKSQELGARFGDAIGGNVAVDGIFTLGKFSRIHGDVSFGKGVGVEALYDFLYRPLGGAEGFDWYVGAGPYAFLGDPFQLGIAGEVGLGGEVRAVNRIENRIAEAEKLGFKAIFVSKYNKLSPEFVEKCSIRIGKVKKLDEMFTYLFG